MKRLRNFLGVLLGLSIYSLLLLSLTETVAVTESPFSYPDRLLIVSLRYLIGMSGPYLGLGISPTHHNNDFSRYP